MRPAEGLEFFSLMVGARRSGPPVFPFDHVWIGVFHRLNRNERTGYEYVGDRSDGTLDPWSPWPLPGIYNRGSGNRYVQPGRTSPQVWVHEAPYER